MSGINKEKKDREKVPIHLKYNLTKEEAAEYFNIGINHLGTLLAEPDCPFVLFVGTKKLIKRKKLEEYIDSTDII